MCSAEQRCSEETDRNGDERASSSGPRDHFGGPVPKGVIGRVVELVHGNADEHNRGDGCECDHGAVEAESRTCQEGSQTSRSMRLY
jgi:hypothetical protein